MTTNAIINSVARLQRAGDASSGANRKLLAAAVRVAEYVAGLVPESGKLPRGWEVCEGWDAPYLRSYRGDVLTEDAITLDAARHLAHDVADGWLAEVAAWIEDQAQQAERDAAALEGATLTEGPCAECGQPRSNDAHHFTGATTVYHNYEPEGWTK